MKAFGVFLVLALILGGCATTNAIKADVENKVSIDLVAARDNFTAANMASEAKCMQQLIDLVGADASQKFQVEGVISLGSVAYIEYSRLQGASRVQIPTDCYALIGKITVAVGRKGAAVGSHGILGN